MDIVDLPEGKRTWAKKEDLKPLSNGWKKFWWVTAFSLLILVLMGVWGLGMALICAYALHEMLEKE